MDLTRSAMDEARPFVVGLTGGIGSGKSSAATHFAALGAFVIDADALAHEVTAPHGVAIAAIDRAFPGTVQAGVLDRAKLREQVFADPVQRRGLEAIVHPLVRSASERALESAAARAAPYVVHMVPLLFEAAGHVARIDCAVVVDVDEATQVARVSSTRGIAPEVVRQIIAAQMPRGDRLRRTQFIIDNNGDPDNLGRQIAPLHATFCANAQRRFRTFDEGHT